MFPVKRQLSVLLHNFGGHENIYQSIHFHFHQFYRNYIGKGEAFHSLLLPYILRLECNIPLSIRQQCKLIHFAQ